MSIHLTHIFGCASIGIYMLATDKIIIVPSSMPKRKAENLAKLLNVQLIQTDLASSPLIGVLACANSRGIILPYTVNEEEVKAIQESWDGEVGIMKSKFTAYGNLILANDKGAIVDSALKSEELKVIREVLDVEVIQSSIAGLPYVGSLAVATNKGVLSHPLIRDEEKKLIEDTLKVPVTTGTVNGGIPYISTGLLSNSHEALVGFLTTGPELFIIGQALGVIEKR